MARPFTFTIHKMQVGEVLVFPGKPCNDLRTTHAQAAALARYHALRLDRAFRTSRRSGRVEITRIR